MMQHDTGYAFITAEAAPVCHSGHGVPTVVDECSASGSENDDCVMDEDYNTSNGSDCESSVDEVQNYSGCSIFQEVESIMLASACEQVSDGIVNAEIMNHSEAASLHLSAHSIPVEDECSASGSENDDYVMDKDYDPAEYSGSESDDCVMDEECNPAEGDESESIQEIEDTATGSGQPVNELETKRKGRKRARNEDKWQRTVRQKNRECGLTYTNRRGKEVSKRQPMPVDCTKCRFQCSVLVSEEERQSVCQYYYSIDNERKKDFLCQVISVSAIDRRRRGRGIRPKNLACSYHLPTDAGHKRVCQKFFTKTCNKKPK